MSHPNPKSYEGSLINNLEQAQEQVFVSSRAYLNLIASVLDAKQTIQRDDKYSVEIMSTLDKVFEVHDRASALNVKILDQLQEVIVLLAKWRGEVK